LVTVGGHIVARHGSANSAVGLAGCWPGLAGGAGIQCAGAGLWRWRLDQAL